MGPADRHAGAGSEEHTLISAIKALDADLAHQLKAAGRAPWQVLAGAAEDTDLVGALLYDDAPYGVCYLVAAWS
ncbi:class III extradiol ring-cleavage dioxygenase family protein [Streptomyces shenzhenensis]|uniref:hypothetical protein n=1 Tax=Streptomyces shenzhenensis TaxID=943815 RepID=UPI00215D9A5F|nr:hypothetical protein [Streptomyces shenzhenensis]